MKHGMVSKFVLPMLLAIASCTQQERTSEGGQNATLAEQEITRLPKEGVTSTLVDFGGKVHLIGHSVEPTSVHPGAQLKLRLYWRAVAPLVEGSRLLTYVIDGRKAHTFDSGGALRQDGLGPATWQPGKLYVDEHTIEIPSEARSKELAIAAGIGVTPKAADPAEGEQAEEGAEPVTVPGFRLPVLSGATDGQHRAILAYVKNDAARKPPARARRLPADALRRAPRAAASAP